MNIEGLGDTAIRTLARKAEGYKVVPEAFYLWFSRSRLRATAMGCACIGFGVWFYALARGID
jgi:hypothetical protein